MPVYFEKDIMIVISDGDEAEEVMSFLKRNKFFSRCEEYREGRFYYTACNQPIGFYLCREQTRAGLSKVRFEWCDMKWFNENQPFSKAPQVTGYEFIGKETCEIQLDEEYL